MPVVALSSHNLHREPRSNVPHVNPGSLSSPRIGTPIQHASRPDPVEPVKPKSVDVNYNELGIAFQPPTPISLNSEFQQHEQASPETSSTGPRAIPPPPNPRRHRSGVLMSRVRATSASNPVPRDGLGMTISKSYGDLSLASATGQVATPKDENTEDEVMQAQAGNSRREWKRAASEVLSLSEEDSTMWDNSARFYHHIHSRPASRTGSRATSPARSPSTSSLSNDLHPSPRDSPIFVRRSVNLAPMTEAIPSHPHPLQLGSLSPNQSFLQQHLPPTFPENLHSSQLLQPDHRPHSMVILTPTTQEWRELKELRRLETGEEDIKEEDSSDSGEPSRRSSLNTEAVGLRRTHSVDYLGEEKHHQRDPGASPERASVPTPMLPNDRGDLTLSSHPSMDEVDLDQPISFGKEEDSPVRFNSIGKRPSLTVLKGAERSNLGRTKTKREREREKLFKDLDDQLEADRQIDSDGRMESSRSGVQEIGRGSLGSRPNSSDSLSSHGSPHNGDMNKSPTHEVVGSVLTHASPSQPLKPSPLHAHPMTAEMNRTSSGSGEDGNRNEILDTPSSAGPSTLVQSPSPNSQAQNLESIRHYARSLASPRPRMPGDATKSGRSTPSPPPPGSPRPGRRRDMANRVSLVAGRVVQPFAVPSSTSLPPGSQPPAQPNLQSFSPFRSPSLGPSKPHGLLPPTFSRLDSTISMAPSTGAPSECSTPTSETAGGIGGRGIDDYVILKEAGKGAYGLVMRAKVKGPKGEPVGDEVIIKYIVKARILADCWKKHKVLGPIPVEIHVMDQLRHLLYNPPFRPHPWDPARGRSDATQTPQDTRPGGTDDSAPNSPDSPGSDSPFGMFSPAQKHIAAEIKHLPERGHPNIAKLLDFFEDKEFYYLVMPRFGTGLDLFDRVESSPEGLTPFEVRSLIGQLADAARFLHSNGIVHRDIKDENVILDGHGRCQLIDFGSAAHWRPGKRWDTFSGTLHYASPEILRGEMYGGKEQDIWALGVVGYVLLVGETPFSELPDEVLDGLSSDSRAETALETRCGGTNFDEGKEQDGGGRLGDAADLVRQCLAMSPGDRPSAEVVCQHRYLRGEDGWVGKKGWIARGWK